MRFLTRTPAAAVAAALLFAAPLFSQTVVRVKDERGRIVCELTIPVGGGFEVVNPVGPVVPPGPVNPPPGPVNPPPPAAAVKGIVIIRDDTPGAMSGGQQALLRDPAVRAAVTRRGWQWDVFDVNSVEVQKPQSQGGLGLGKFLNDPNLPQAPNLRAPCVIFYAPKGQNGFSPLVRGIPLPADSASFIAAIGG